MELVGVLCNSCGAPLLITADARIVTCSHCTTQLVVKQNESITFTEPLGEIDERTKRIAEAITDMRYRQELADLERDRKRECQAHMILDRNGKLLIPSVMRSLVGGVVLVVIGLMFVGGSTDGGGVGGAMVGIICISFGAFTTALFLLKARSYRAAERKYHRHRGGVERQRTELRARHVL